MAYVFKEFPKHVLGKIVQNAAEEAALRAKHSPPADDPFVISAAKGRDLIGATFPGHIVTGPTVTADAIQPPDIILDPPIEHFVDGPVIVTPFDEAVQREAEERAGDEVQPVRRGPGRPPKAK